MWCEWPHTRADGDLEYDCEGMEFGMAVGEGREEGME